MTHIVDCFKYFPSQIQWNKWSNYDFINILIQVMYFYQFQGTARVQNTFQLFTISQHYYNFFLNMLDSKEMEITFPIGLDKMSAT